MLETFNKSINKCAKGAIPKLNQIYFHTLKDPESISERFSWKINLSVSPTQEPPLGHTHHVVQDLHCWVLQFSDLLFYDVLKSLVVAEAWELPPTVLVFVFPHSARD